MLRLNRKGAFKLTKEVMLWLTVRFVIVFVVVFVIISIFSSYISRKIEVDEIQQYVLRERLLLSKDCLAYEDEKVYGGIVDINKFNEDRLNNCLRYRLPKGGVGIKLNLSYNRNEKIIDINEDVSKKMNFCIDKKNFACSNNDYYVLVYDNGLKRGNLNIQMIRVK